jgi:hypothetical protein
MQRTDQLNPILAGRLSDRTGIESAAVFSSDGLIISDTLPQSIDEGLYAAMGSSIQVMGKRISRELLRGELEQMFVRSDNGYLIATKAGADATLIAVAPSHSQLGLLFYDLKKAAERVADALG